MTDSAQRKEVDAFLGFFSAFELSQPVVTISDLSDGAVLFQVLSLVDAEYFRQTSGQPSDNWVYRFNALKRLYRLMTQYFSDALQKPSSSLDVPDLQAIAKDHDAASILILCRLAIAIGVQCENNKEFIGKIQALGEADQHYLMKAIEQVMGRLSSTLPPPDDGEAMTEDDHYYRLQSEKRQILSEKQTLEKVYQDLLKEHRTLQTTVDDIALEKEEALAQARESRREPESPRRNDRSDAMFKAEIDRLRVDLQKSEENLAVAETELEKSTNMVAEMTRRNDELQGLAEEASRLKDQVDEYRHAADKLQKTENVMEKYKKKLQEGADLRQHVKSLEKQNAELVDQNASLEEEYRRVAAFKPLMESYKNQIADLESKHSSRSQEIDALKFELEQSQTKLRITTAERAKDSETLDLYQERVRELELTSTTRPKTSVERSNSEGEFTMGDLLGDTMEDGTGAGLGGELDDAITGTTPTDLKLQIRKLKRELESVRKNEVDASRVLVLENLLEDANRMKGRYENDYLAAHREKLVLQRDLDDIRSGKSMGDGAEAAIALRQRLNETVEKYEALREQHTKLEVDFEGQSKELIVAKSDLTLVNKDQLDILASLRDSVNEDKAGLESEVEKLRKHNKELNDKNRMQMEQVNDLLLEKVGLQSEGINQREKMLDRERVFGDLRASLSGKDLPEDIKTRLLALHEENVNLKESYKVSQDKLSKAKQFIKSQDKLFKEQHAQNVSSPSANFGDEEATFRSHIKVLEDDLARQKHIIKENVLRYQKEQELLLGLLHSMGMDASRSHMRSQSKSVPTSWLGTQRTNHSHTLQRH